MNLLGALCKIGGVKMPICPVFVVLVFIALDVATGIAKAFATTGFDSSIMRQGFFHKLGEIFAVALSMIADIGLPDIGVPLDIQLSGLCCAYLVFMEIGSIIENIGAINPELVGPLNKIFAKLRGDNHDS